MARFVIADLTDLGRVQHELTRAREEYKNLERGAPARGLRSKVASTFSSSLVSIRTHSLFSQAALLVAAFTPTRGNGDANAMTVDVEKVITDKAEETRKTFRALLDKTNKEQPNPKDLKALSDPLAATENRNSGVMLRVPATSQRSW